jgi:DNA polymerase I-like protein with 3'-5' exonuclease and polymerase domains
MTDIVTVDFETYYDKDYSLAKMTTEAYIRDPRFEVIGVSVKVNDAETDWYSGPDPGRFLRSLDWSGKWMLAHNCAFDASILSWHFDVHPTFLLDTMSMARPMHANGCGVSLKALAQLYGLQAKGDEVVHALGKRRKDFTPAELDRYADYCIGDTNITYDLFETLRQVIPRTALASELMCIDTTLKMFTEPMLVLDKPKLEAHLLAERTRKEKILAKLGGDKAKALLNSSPKFADVLRTLGVEPPMKTSKTTGEPTYAFAKDDKDFLALQMHDDPRVQAVVGARLGTKSSLEETRTQSFLEIAERGPLPVPLKYYAAHTGRFGGYDKINLQNLPRGGALRDAICAPDGHTLVTCDLSQIEARVLAVIAGEWNLVQAFREGRDIYSEFASKFYGWTVNKTNKVERFVGKTSILGLGFGMGWEKFQHTLAIGQGGVKAVVSADQARNLVHMYRSQNSSVVKFWEAVDAAINDMFMGGCGELAGGLIQYDPQGMILPNGMRIDYPKLKRGKRGFEYVNDMRLHKKDPENGCTNIYGGKATENLVQAIARIVIVEMMNKIAKRYRVVLQVHDEIITCVPDADVPAARAFMEKVMNTPPKWLPQIPVACESGVGKTYGEAK